MKKIILLIMVLASVVIIGCAKECPECPITECDECEICLVCSDCIECEECNATECEEGNYDRSYVTGLIIEAKKCEKSQYYYNMSDLQYELNRTQQQLERCEDDTDIDNVTIELRKCEDELEDYEDGLCEDKLEECEDNLCDEDSSWC